MGKWILPLVGRTAKSQGVYTAKATGVNISRGEELRAKKDNDYIHMSLSKSLQQRSFVLKLMFVFFDNKES